MLDNEKAARHKRISRVIMWVILLALFLCFIFPFVLVIINVFKTKADITSDPLALIGAHGFTLKNFPEAMKKMNFSRVFLNSAIITTSATVLTILVSSMTAFVMVRKNIGILKRWECTANTRRWAGRRKRFYDPSTPEAGTMPAPPCSGAAQKTRALPQERPG